MTFVKPTGAFVRRHLRTIITAILIFAAGWLARSYILNPVIPAAQVFSSTVTLVVAWWIAWALKRQGDLSKVPIDAIGKIFSRIDELVVACLDRPATTPTTDPDLLRNLTSLANEIDWLCTVAGRFGCDAASSQLLKNCSHDFYNAATIDFEVDWAGCTEQGRLIRGRSLLLQWMISDQILQRADDPEKIRQLLEREF